jgi:hypothetical protein
MNRASQRATSISSSPTGKGSTHFLLKKQLVSISMVPSSSKFQIRDHARLLKQELHSSSTYSMFGWSNELVRPPFFRSFPFFLFMERNRLIQHYLSPHKK